jgi:hypothetical protein
VYDAQTTDNLLSGNTSLYNILAANDDKDIDNTAAQIKQILVVPGKKYWVQLDGSRGGSFGECEIELVNYSTLLYPNPSDGNFSLQISYPGQGKINVDVYSTSGSHVYSGELYSSLSFIEIPVDISQCSQGVYFVKVNINGNVVYKKLVLYK